ncbi:MAG: sulfite oxidase heme-binding subunit YedZ [Myxococcales bacterium]
MSVLSRLTPVAFLLCLTPAAVLAWNFWGVTHDRPEALGADPVRAAEIFTGLWTLRFLAITLAVTPVRELLGIGALAKYRRMLGLFTFFYACVHLSMWVGVDWFFDWRAMGGEIVKHKYILIGMTTFVLLLPLALTSTNAAVRRLGGARWARLHRLVYVCAITGTVHYLWAVKKDTLFPLIYLLVFAALLGFRLWEHYVGPIRLRSRGAGRRRAQSRSSALAGAATTDTRPLRDAK